MSSEMNGDALGCHGPRTDRYHHTACVFGGLGRGDDAGLSVPRKSQHRCVDDRSELTVLYSHFLSF